MIQKGKWSAVASSLMLGAAAVIFIFAFKTKEPDRFHGVFPESFDIDTPVVVSTDTKVNKVESQSVATQHGDSHSTSHVERLQFPDGTVFSLRFRDPTPSAVDVYQLENLAHGYYDLREKAENGNSLAASALATYLNSCKSVFYESEDDLENDILTTSTYKSVDPHSGQVSDNYLEEDREIALEALRSSVRFCQWTTDDMKAEAESWYKTAAELGSVRDMLEYAQVELAGTSEGHSMLRRAFEKGHHSAATALGYTLLESTVGDQQPQNLAAQEIERRRVDGFAYLYLGVALSYADRTLAGTSMPVHLRRRLEKSAQHLMPREREAGIERAKEILSSLPGCCQSSIPYSTLD